MKPAEMMYLLLYFNFLMLDLCEGKFLNAFIRDKVWFFMLNDSYLKGNTIPNL